MPVVKTAHTTPNAPRWPWRPWRAALVGGIPALALAASCATTGPGPAEGVAGERLSDVPCASATWATHAPEPGQLTAGESASSPAPEAPEGGGAPKHEGGGGDGGAGQRPPSRSEERALDRIGCVRVEP